jgi:fatty-acid peroxygenase
MRTIPRDSSPESTLALLRHPFRFIPDRCRRFGTDVFEARLLLRRTICISGPEAAAVFSDPARFMREGAVPPRVMKTLFGLGGVQSLDGEAHRHRKAMFMRLMTPERMAALRGIARRIWLERAALWGNVETVELYGQARSILTRAVCEWAGVPLPERDVEIRARQFSCMFDSVRTFGPAHWRALHARQRAEAWARDIVAGVRSGRVRAVPGSALAAIATFRDLDGELLDPQTAAVELLNLLRPTVATAVWIVYVALALHRYPEVRTALGHEPEYAEWFAQEVRRYYPFFPLIAARVRDTFEWNGYRFPKDARVVLDLYGTDHDARAWSNPDVFDPLRFRRWDGDEYRFVPHGPGDPNRHHRCAGERMTVELIKMAAEMLTVHLRYEVPVPQDLTIDWSRLPALPRSRFILGRVVLVHATPAPIEPRRSAAEVLDPVNVRRFDAAPP